jgi:Carboxypeptidase regulatory-like domain
MALFTVVRGLFRRGASVPLLLCLFAALFAPTLGFAQTGDTGAIAGEVTDPAGSVVPESQIKVINLGTGASRTTVSGRNGSYSVPLLPPGQYRVDISKAGFKLVSYPNITVIVTETQTLNARLEVGAVSEQVTVDSAAEQLQTASSALGRVTNEEMVTDLPLATRNFTQIIGLNPGVSAEVTNPTALGLGGGGMSNFSTGGQTQKSNNYQMDGVAIDDLQNSGTFSGGVAIPNPDTILEFKVQTSQYDATFGRNAGANVNVISKGGSNAFHGTLFEFLRNTDLNSNDFFFNRAGTPRPQLKQNQFGGTIGGPVVKNKLFFFGSYQGTRQVNGVSGNCSATFTQPPLTNNRSAAALGALFAGQRGLEQTALGNVGPAILPDGSNISPQALALFNLKLPSGQYAIPTPQEINPSQPFATQGISVLSSPCPFSEDQYMANADYTPNAKSRIAFRFFRANDNTTETFPVANVGGPTAPGWPLTIPTNYTNASLTYTYILTPSLLNEFEAAYHRTWAFNNQAEPIKYSQAGISVPSYDDGIPAINLNGSVSLGGNGQSLENTQNTYILQDSMSWTHGRHVIRFGGGVTRVQNNLEGFHYIAALIFLSYPDLLLGLNAAQSGTAAVGVPVGNVYESVDLPGIFDRAFRTWGGDVYFQDDFKVSRRFTANLGFRFERFGNISDALGRNGNIDPDLINTNPPATGTLQGYVVPSNYTGPLPTGVTKLSNNLGYSGAGQNTLNPRVGFAWELPGTDRFVLRGGYGVYHDQTTGQPFIQMLTNAPFAVLNQLAATQNSTATLATPFPPAVTLPVFPAYSPTTKFSTTIIGPYYRPPTVQQYSMGLQTRVVRDMVLTVTYSGARGVHLNEERTINQAGFASASNPIDGVTTNTVANIQQRVPYLGFTASGMNDIYSNGESWYNSLGASMEKRLSHGLQFLASYTYARSFSTAGSSIAGANGGVPVGDQNRPSQTYGPDSFIRDQRFVLSGLYALPLLHDRNAFVRTALGGWRLGGVFTMQTGQRLTLTTTTSTNIYGITNDRVQMAAGCTYPQLTTSGGVESRLFNYLNKSCVTTAPVVGSDGKGTTFGNAGVGIVRGPDQSDVDLSIVKQFPLPAWTDHGRLEFRAEFFNALNHPSFSNPSVSFTSASFGQILTETVSPRLVQFALKFVF